MANDLVPAPKVPALIEDEKPWNRPGASGPPCQLFCDVETAGVELGPRGHTTIGRPGYATSHNLGLWVLVNGIYHPVDNIAVQEVRQRVEYREHQRQSLDYPPSHIVPDPPRHHIKIDGVLIGAKYEG